MASPVATFVSFSPALPLAQIGIGSLRLGRRERAYLRQVIASNRLSYGPFSRRLERLFGDIHGCRHSIFCSSGTAALQIALGALKEQQGWRDGDEVLVPALTFVSTINVILHNRLTPVLVDVDPRTYNLDPPLLAARLTRRTRAVLPVHLLGLPCDMGPIGAFAARHRLRIVEDSCETMFAQYRGRPVGALGDVGCFSTYLAHFIAAGIGGFATTNDADLAVRMRSLMNHGRDEAYLSIDDDQHLPPARLHEVVAKRFAFVRVGHNFRATEFEAAVALGQLEERARIIARRQAIARFYLRHLADLAGQLQLPWVPPQSEHMFMLFPLVLRSGDRRAFVNFLEERRIETRDFFPVVTQPLYRRLLRLSPQAFPVAARLAQRGVLIGCHQHLRPQELRHVVDTIHAYFRRHHGNVGRTL